MFHYAKIQTKFADPCDRFIQNYQEQIKIKKRSARFVDKKIAKN